MCGVKGVSRSGVQDFETPGSCHVPVSSIVVLFGITYEFQKGTTTEPMGMHNPKPLNPTDPFKGTLIDPFKGPLNPKL